jgi:SAM-dependent methyltransferase
MREALLKHIVCPICREDFTLDARRREGAHVMEGRLWCRGCIGSYRIEAGVPVLLEQQLVNMDNTRTADRFGYEWERFDFLSSAYEPQFLDWVWPITRDFFSRKLVLDAGCGKGRHAVCSTRFGAREVIGIDLAAGSVNAAFRNTREMENVHIVRADIFNLPFRDETFDYVYSIGVLHHTPDPRRAFSCLARKLRRGGTISVWVYGKEGNWWITTLLNPIRLAITSRLPLGVTRAIAFVLAVVLQLALKTVYRPVNRIAWLKRLSRFLFYNDYLYYISGFSFRENYSIVFDHLLPEIAHYLPRDEVLAWLSDDRFEDVAVTRRTNNSWRGKGRKKEAWR